MSCCLQMQEGKLQGKWRGVTNATSFFRGDENISKLIVLMVAQLGAYIKSIKLDTLNEWVLCELYYNMAVALSSIYVIQSMKNKTNKQTKTEAKRNVIYPRWELSSLNWQFSSLSSVSCQLFPLSLF